MIYVDGTYIINFRMEKIDDAAETHYHLQESVTNWGKLLRATGGALKSSKCFFHLVSFQWRPDGTWKYDTNENNNEFRITVPTCTWDGSNTQIDHHGVHHATKTLGSMTCPSGWSHGAIQAMQEKSLNWATMV